MTMPQELSPLALWAAPLLLLCVWRHIIYTIGKHEKKLDEVIARKLECVREFALKEDVGELEDQVRSITSDVASLKALAHTPECRS